MLLLHLAGLSLGYEGEDMRRAPPINLQSEKTL